MHRHGGWRVLAGCTAILAATLSSGCLGFVHPAVSPVPVDQLPCADLPLPCKHRVHIFFIHGVDPLDLANFDGLCDFVHSLGFLKTHLGVPYHTFYFEQEISRLHQVEPTSRFVLVGFSYGAGMARDLTYSLARENIPVDLLVYLDGVPFGKQPLDHPANAAHVVNILSRHRDPGLEVSLAVNVQYNNVGHFGAATDPRTLKLLANELAVVARRVPITDPPLPPLPPAFQVPRPQPALPGPSVLPPPEPGPSVLPPPQPRPEILPAPRPSPSVLPQPQTSPIGLYPPRTTPTAPPPPSVPKDAKKKAR